MAEYAVEEMADMHLIYGEARGNAREAERLYQERFPGRRHPCRATFVTIDRRLRETGLLLPRRQDAGAPRRVRTARLEEEVLQRFAADPSTSTRAVAHALGTSQTLVWNVMHDNGQHPYHRQTVQALRPNDYQLRVQFSEWYLWNVAVNPAFGERVLFSDEAQFTKDGPFNCHNSHVWSDANPHATHVTGHQERFHVNMWAGIVHQHIIGPYEVPPRLNGQRYLAFLQDTLPELLEDVTLDVRIQMWFQHDGATPHFTRAVRRFLDETFPQRWIGRGGPITWPPRSPDLTPLDFFFWGHLKSKVYATPVATVDELRARIFRTCRELQQNPEVFQRVRQNMIRRCHACIGVGGRHFEQLL